MFPVERFPALAALLDVRAALKKLQREGKILWQADPVRLPSLIEFLHRLEADYGLRLRVLVRGSGNRRDLEMRLVELIRSLDLPPFRMVQGTSEKEDQGQPGAVRLIVDLDPEHQRARAVMTDGLPWFRAQNQPRPTLLYDGASRDLALVLVRRFVEWYRAELERVRTLPPGRSATRWEALERQLVYLWATPDFDSLAARTADLWVQDVLKISALRLLRGVPSAALPGAPEELRALPIGYQVLRMDLTGRFPLELISLRDGAELVRVRIHPQPVYIDRWEVSRRQYLRFVLMQGHGLDNERVVVDQSAESLDSAMDRVSWFDAMAYLQWAGRSLPTAADWRLASRGAVIMGQWAGRRAPVFVAEDLASTGCVNSLGGVAEWLADAVNVKAGEKDAAVHRLAVVPQPERPGAVRFLPLVPGKASANLGFRGALVLPATSKSGTLGPSHRGESLGTGSATGG